MAAVQFTIVMAVRRALYVLQVPRADRQILNAFAALKALCVDRR